MTRDIKRATTHRPPPRVLTTERRNEPLRRNPKPERKPTGPPPRYTSDELADLLTRESIEYTSDVGNTFRFVRACAKWSHEFWIGRWDSWFVLGLVRDGGVRRELLSRDNDIKA